MFDRQAIDFKDCSDIAGAFVHEAQELINAQLEECDWEARKAPVQAVPSAAPQRVTSVTFSADGTVKDAGRKSLLASGFSVGTHVVEKKKSATDVRIYQIRDITQDGSVKISEMCSNGAFASLRSNDSADLSPTLALVPIKKARP